MARTEHRESLIPWPEDVPVIPLFPDAARPFGIAKSRAYYMAQRGDFPVRTLRVGGRWCVRTVDLREALGLPITRHAVPEQARAPA
jgi:hypothetical protein